MYVYAILSNTDLLRNGRIVQCVCVLLNLPFLQSIRIRKTRPHFFTDRRERPKSPVNVGNGVIKAGRYIVKYVEGAFLRCNAAGMVWAHRGPDNTATVIFL